MTVVGNFLEATLQSSVDLAECKTQKVAINAINEAAMLNA